MIAFAIACLLTQHSPKVSVSTGGAPVEVILRDISQQSGVSLHAGQTVRGEILLVQAKDVSVDDLMKQIAKADGAEWTRDGDGYTLSRPARIRNAEEATEIAERTAVLAKTLDEHVKTALAPAEGLGTHLDPDVRLAWRAMQALGPATLARLKSGTREVFAPQPNPVQKRWSGSLQPMVQTYLEETKLLTQALTKEAKTKALPPQPEGAKVTRALVALSSSIFQGYVVHVFLFDAKGGLITDATANMQMPEFDEIERQMTSKAPKASGEPLVLSDAANEFVSIAKAALAQKPVAFSPAMMGRILDPGKYDPLALFVGDALGAVARKNSRSLVASVPDFCFLTGLFLANGALTEDTVRHWIGQTSVVDESSDGWMVIHPRFPIETRELRVDREKMGAFYRKAWKNGGVRLGELGAYIASQPRRYTETISLFYAFFCMPEIAHMFEPEGLGALRTYGLLTEDQRAALEKGESIPVNLLSPEARAELADWIYNGSGSGFGGRTYEWMYVDPTDAFPNGLALPAELSQTGSTVDAVIPLYNGSNLTDINGADFDATSLGYALGRQDSGEGTSNGSMSSFLMGKRMSLNLQFASPKLTLNGNMKETRFDRKAKALTLNELPQSFRDTVVKMRAEYIQQRANDPARQGTGTPPPQP